MKTLNLVDINKSDIKYQVQRFPDGQQNIVINKMFIIGIKLLTVDSQVNSLFAGDFPVWKEPIEIKSRLNNWLDLELIVCTAASLRELGVEEIHLYVPYIIGARSDRKFEEGGNNYIKDVIAPVINSLNFKSVTCIDPHSDVLEACIKGFRKESNEKLVRFFYENLEMQQRNGCSIRSAESICNNTILVSPDAGASKKIYKLAEQIGYKGDIITCSKDRDNNGKLTKTVVPAYDTGPLIMKDYIIIDDICDGGATFINIAKELKKLYNCNRIYLIVTHGIFSKGFKELAQYFNGIYCTNSYRDTEFGPPLEKNGFCVKQLNVF